MTADGVTPRRTKALEALEAELLRLPGLDRDQLQRTFLAVYGCKSPVRLTQPLLALAIAHRLQEAALGGLKPGLRQQLVAQQFKAPVKVDVGTVLIREWHGVHHRVTVRTSGVEYRGTSYRSLSEVVTVITGSKRSGPLFFGLKGKTNG